MLQLQHLNELLTHISPRQVPLRAFMLLSGKPLLGNGLHPRGWPKPATIDQAAFIGRLHTIPRAR